MRQSGQSGYGAAGSGAALGPDPRATVAAASSAGDRRSYSSADGGRRSSITNLDPRTAFQKSGIINLQDQMADPLLARGNAVVHVAKVEAQERGRLTVHATLLAIIPWSVFVSSLSFGAWASATRYPFESLLFYFLVSGCFIIYCTAVLRDQGARQTQSRWRRWAGRLSQVGNILGLAAGVYAHYAYFIYYNTYTGMRPYTNVAVSEPVDQFTDAGYMSFTADTSLDGSRAVGYKSATSNSMLCVAPLVDGSMGLGSEVHFFAVGVNCCEPRASFSCDDALDGSTKSAILMLEPDSIAGPATEWALSNTLDRSGFDAAIRMQTAAFGTVVADYTRLVYWTKEPKTLAKQYYNHGLEFMLVSAAGYFTMSVFITWHHMFAPKWMTNIIG